AHAGTRRAPSPFHQLSPQSVAVHARKPLPNAIEVRCADNITSRPICEDAGPSSSALGPRLGPALWMSSPIASVLNTLSAVLRRFTKPVPGTVWTQSIIAGAASAEIVVV